MNRKNQHNSAQAAPVQAGVTDILWSIWAIWVILIFVVTMLIILIPFLVFSWFRPEPQKTGAWVVISRIWMTVFLPLAGCPFRVKGKENFKKGETYIVLCNHNALLDVPISYPFIPGGNKTIAKIEMAKIPIFGLMYRTGSVLVDRKDENSRKDSFTKMKEVLGMGIHMCLYPEGTRNKSDQPLKEFHNGAFRLALSTGKAIIPALIFNTRKVMPPDKKLYFRPHSLAMHFLPPIVPTKDDTAETLKQKAFDIMWQYYTAHQRSY